MENKNILFAAGLGSTGSSALVDLLKEVNGFYSMDDEFRMFVDPGGLVNLRDALVDNWSIFQSDMAIRNFVNMSKAINKKYKSPYISLEHKRWFGDKFDSECVKFIESLTELKFKGVWYGIDNLLMRKLNRFSLLRKTIFGSKTMYVGKNITDDYFSEKVEMFINALIEPVLKEKNANYFCFNENLSCMFPEKILSMLPSSKMILVIRDPKDVYADSLRVKWAAIPEEPSEFIKWQTLVYKGWMDVQLRLNDNIAFENKLMVVKFEDLVNDYESKVSEIFKFLEINDKEHVNKEMYFKPSESRNNIAQWEELLTPKDIELFDEQLSFFYNYYNYN